MGKKKNVLVPASAAAESSINAESRAIENLKFVNDKLLREATEHQMKIQEPRQQLTAATELIETAVVNLNAKETQLLVVVRETEEKKKDLIDSKESLRSSEQAKQRAKTWKKWLYPVAAATTFCVVGAVVTLCCKNFRSKS